MNFFAVPTRRGLLFLLLTLAALAVAFMNSGLITAFTSAMFSAILVSGFVMANFSLAGTVIERKFPDKGYCNKVLYMDLVIKNRLYLYRQEYIVTEKLPFLLSREYAFAVPALAPGEERFLSFQIQAEKRGEYQLEKVYLCSGDPLGLFRKKKLFRLPARITILPRVFPLSSLAAVNRRGGMPHPEGRMLGHAGKGQEFFGVRPYRTGDEVKHIHWKSTASKGRLMVKEFEASAVDQIVLLLDTEKKMISMEMCDNNFEFLIACANSITEYLSRRYCYLQFFAAEDQKDGLHFLSGDASSVKGRIQQLLTDLQGSKQSFSRMLSLASEQIPNGAIVYLLSMSPEKVAEYMGLLEEKDCYCFFLYAPPENFPPVENDKPRVLDRDRIKEMLKKLPEEAGIADFTSNAEELLESGNIYEKL